jgi:hypothetical protein
MARCEDQDQVLLAPAVGSSGARGPVRNGLPHYPTDTTEPRGICDKAVPVSAVCFSSAAPASLCFGPTISLRLSQVIHSAPSSVGRHLLTTFLR